MSEDTIADLKSRIERLEKLVRNNSDWVLDETTELRGDLSVAEKRIKILNEMLSEYDMVLEMVIASFRTTHPERMEAFRAANARLDALTKGAPPRAD